MADLIQATCGNFEFDWVLVYITYFPEYTDEEVESTSEALLESGVISESPN